MIKRNFDPVTLNLSPYVNDTLYTYRIDEFAPPPFQYADASELVQFGDALASAPVASGLLTGGSFAGGNFFTGIATERSFADAAECRCTRIQR